MNHVYKETLNRVYKSLKRKLLITVLALVPIMSATFYGTYKINQFFDQNTLKFRSPLQSPVVILKRDTPISYTAEAQTIPLWQQLNLTGIEKDICSYFDNDCKTMLAIAMGESSLIKDRINYNCMYGSVSKSCKPTDISKAWSVDCGLFQVSVKGKNCPAKLLEPFENMRIAKEIKQNSGLNSWVVYSNGSFLKYLNQLEKR